MEEVQDDVFFEDDADVGFGEDVPPDLPAAQPEEEEPESSGVASVVDEYNERYQEEQMNPTDVQAQNRVIESAEYLQKWLEGNDPHYNTSEH